MNLFLDTETIPADNAELIAEIAATITPPGNYSKPETIAKWEAETKPGLVREAVAKTAFDGTYGQMICIGFAFDLEPADSIICDSRRAEGNVLNTFLRRVEERATHQDVVVVGHNVSWDLRFMWQRAIVNRVRVGQKIKWQSKPWDIAVRDTMTMWNPERDRKIKLETLCKILGVPSPKGEMDGSKVWAAWEAGEAHKIAEYCRLDVAAMRECYLRMSGDVSMVRP